MVIFYLIRSDSHQAHDAETHSIDVGVWVNICKDETFAGPKMHLVMYEVVTTFITVWPLLVERKPHTTYKKLAVRRVDTQERRSLPAGTVVKVPPAGELEFLPLGFKRNATET